MSKPLQAGGPRGKHAVTTATRCSERGLGASFHRAAEQPSVGIQDRIACELARNWQARQAVEAAASGAALA